MDSIETERKAGGFHRNRAKGRWSPQKENERPVDSIETERKAGRFHRNRMKDRPDPEQKLHDKKAGVR